MFEIYLHRTKRASHARNASCCYFRIYLIVFFIKLKFIAVCWWECLLWRACADVCLRPPVTIFRFFTVNLISDLIGRLVSHRWMLYTVTIWIIYLYFIVLIINRILNLLLVPLCIFKFALFVRSFIVFVCILYIIWRICDWKGAWNIFVLIAFIYTLLLNGSIPLYILCVKNYYTWNYNILPPIIHF